MGFIGYKRQTAAQQFRRIADLITWTVEIGC
jgi:hypothetical protein